jgi:hypothetical protein
MNKSKFFVVFIFILSMISEPLVAQMHEKTGKNLGVTLFGGLQYTHSKEFAQKLKPYSLFGAGITRSFGDLLFPEVNYTYSKGNYGFSDSLETPFTTINHSLGIGMNTKPTIFRFSMGKSNKGECTWMNIKLILGAQYTFHLKNNANFTINHPNDFFLESGIGVLPKYSGGHKSRVAWSYFIDVVYRWDMTKNTSFSLNEVTGFKNSALLLRMTIVHYRTYDFLGGNQKKKSYNKKY